MNNTIILKSDDLNTQTTDILGYISTGIFTILLIPQVYKTTKTKSAKDISMVFLLLSESGCSLMIPYCVLLKLTPILISNIIMLILNSYLIIFKILDNNNFFKNKIFIDITPV